MKYVVVRTKRFKTAYKKIQEIPQFKQSVFESVVETLANGQVLDRKYKDHKLSGRLQSFRECHLAPDILLIYQIDDSVLILTLVAIGSHSQLFT